MIDMGPFESVYHQLENAVNKRRVAEMLVSCRHHMGKNSLPFNVVCNIAAFLGIELLGYTCVPVLDGDGR